MTYFRLELICDDRHLGNLTLEQQSKLDKFRKEVHNAGYVDRTEDATLVLFLLTLLFGRSTEVRLASIS